MGICLLNDDGYETAEAYVSPACGLTFSLKMQVLEIDVSDQLLDLGDKSGNEVEVRSARGRADAVVKRPAVRKSSCLLRQNRT